MEVTDGFDKIESMKMCSEDFWFSLDKYQQILDLLHCATGGRRFFAIASAIVPFLHIGTAEDHEQYGCGYINGSGYCENVIPFGRRILTEATSRNRICYAQAAVIRLITIVIRRISD